MESEVEGSLILGSRDIASKKDVGVVPQVIPAGSYPRSPAVMRTN